MAAKKQGLKISGDPTVKQTFLKAMHAGSNWSDKDEFLDVIYWLRQILGILIGIVWAVVPMKGLFGLALFFIINLGIVYVYYSMFQQVNEDEYGGVSEILKEGLMTSFATFIVTWVIIYSAVSV